MSPNNFSKILVIDDELSICIAIKDLLEMYDYKAEYANSAEEGIDYLKDNPDTDVVVLDINLGPGLNGIETLEIIKNRYKYIQILMFTSINTLDIGVECMKKGAMDYVTKPYDDIEFLKKIATAIERKQSEQMKDLYQGIIVHDLKNPLQHILSALEFLRLSMQEKISDQQKKLFSSAEQGITQIKIMVNNILSISKFESGILVPRKDSFHLQQEVAQIVELFEKDAKMQEKNISIIFKTPDDYIFCNDRDFFSRILTNITSNALRFTPSNGYITVAFHAQEDDNFLSVRVTNSGSFIKESLRSSIFDKFSAIQTNENTISNQNYGLGLTYCKMAIIAMEGEIGVDGDKEIPETTFYYTIRNFRND